MEEMNKVSSSNKAANEGLIHPNEKILGGILMVFGGLAWLGVIVGTVGIALIFMAIGFFFYVLTLSGFISHLKGSGAIITEEQFPDLHDALKECAAKLNVEKLPTMILMHADGIFNALAVRFLRRHYIVLFSDMIDAVQDNPDAVRFYIGHELGHIKRNHLLWQPIMAPVSWLPLIGAAYSRSREKTCDRHGLACCASKDAAARGMAVLAVGGHRSKTLNLKAYMKQLQAISGFWMSYHEIIADYPYLAKRLALLGTEESRLPKRNKLAWVLALFTPRLNLMSLVAIYLIMIVGVGVGGAFKEGGLINNAQNISSSDAYAVQDDAYGSAEGVPQQEEPYSAQETQQQEEYFTQEPQQQEQNPSQE